MQVRELIGGVIECEPGATLREAATMMTELDIGALVVRDRGTMAGILSERDVLTAAAQGKDLGAETAERWMTTDVGSVDAGTDINDAAAWLLGAGYRHLPVTGDSGTVIGIVSIKDILWAIRDTAPTS